MIRRQDVVGINHISLLHHGRRGMVIDAWNAITKGLILHRNRVGSGGTWARNSRGRVETIRQRGRKRERAWKQRTNLENKKKERLSLCPQKQKRGRSGR